MIRILLSVLTFRNRCAFVISVESTGTVCIRARLSVRIDRERYGVGARSCGDCEGERGELQSASLVHKENGIY